MADIQLRDQPPSRKPDAAAFPHKTKFPVPDEARAQAYYKGKYASAFGWKPNQRIYFSVNGPMYFATPEHSPSIYFPRHHIKQSAERYEWWVIAPNPNAALLANPERASGFYDRPEAVKFGWLVPEEDVEEPSLDQKAEFLSQHVNHDAKYAMMGARVSQLAPYAQDLDAAEKEELQEILRIFRPSSQE